MMANAGSLFQTGPAPSLCWGALKGRGCGSIEDKIPAQHLGWGSWSQEAQELLFLQCNGGPSDSPKSPALRLSGSLTPTLWFQGRHWNSFSLTFLICKMDLASSPAFPWAVREDGSGGSLPPEPSPLLWALGQGMLWQELLYHSALPHIQTQPLLFPELGQVTVPSMTQFSPL